MSGGDFRKKTEKPEEKVKERVTQTEAKKEWGVQGFCGNVSLSPPPPYFPSELHGHLAALAETTGVFPLGCLVVCLRVYLSVCLPPQLQVLTVVLVIRSVSRPVCVSSSQTICVSVWHADSFSLESRALVSPLSQVRTLGE